MQKIFELKTKEYSQELVDLFQDYTAHHEMVYHLSPLTAQIYTFILFRDARNGVTFDEIVEILKSSKSSVSTSLNLLLSQNLIEHFNKINERKRYFRVNPNFVTERLEKIREVLVKEHILTTKMKQLAEKGVIEVNNCHDKIDVFIKHLDISEKHLLKTIENLKNTN